MIFLGTDLDEICRKENEEFYNNLEIDTSKICPLVTCYIVRVVKLHCRLISEELERNQADIAELSDKLAQLAEKNFELETELENEELKLKTCSSETQKICDTMVDGELSHGHLTGNWPTDTYCCLPLELDKKIKEYTLKQDFYKHTYHVELDLNKGEHYRLDMSSLVISQLVVISEKKLLKVKFINSNQEVLIKYINAHLFRGKCPLLSSACMHWSSDLICRFLASYETKSDVLNDPVKAKEFDLIIQKFNDLTGTKRNLKDLINKLREFFNWKSPAFNLYIVKNTNDYICKNDIFQLGSFLKSSFIRKKNVCLTFLFIHWQRI